MKLSHILALALLALLCQGAKCNNEKEEVPEVSPECAAVLLVMAGGGAAAASVVVANTILPSLLCSGGFCAAGVAKGSMASWWQSTLPLVSSGSLFSTLQSIAMGGAATTGTAAAIGAALGAGASTAFLADFCQKIDQAEQDTVLGEAVKTNLKLYRRMSGIADATASYVSSAKNVASEAIATAAPYVSDAKDVTLEACRATWNWISARKEKEAQEAWEEPK